MFVLTMEEGAAYACDKRLRSGDNRLVLQSTGKKYMVAPYTP